MFRGTTPTLEFSLPIETSTLSEAWITLAQCGQVVINKTLSDCEIGENTLDLTLTQDETLALSSEAQTEIQLRVKTSSGKAFASKIFTESTERILKDGVL